MVKIEDYDHARHPPETSGASGTGGNGDDDIEAATHLSTTDENVPGAEDTTSKGELESLNIEAGEGAALIDKKGELNREKISRDIETQQDFWSQFMVNVRTGPIGKRGEEWAALQVLLMLCIVAPPQFLVSGFSYLLSGPPGHFHRHESGSHHHMCHIHAPGGRAVDFVFGPFAFLLGLVTIFVALKGIGKFLSPFPRPPPGTHLVKDGAYSWVRHPVYSGILLAALGLTKLSCSPARLICTVLLWAALEKKVRVEEGFLVERFGQSYEEYKKAKREEARAFHLLTKGGRA
eukprot:jgi/Mesen1/7447/ME000389S06787